MTMILHNIIKMPEPIETPPAGEEAVVEVDNSAPAGEQKDKPEGTEGGDAEKVDPPTVPLSDFSKLKDTMSRLVGNDPEKLKGIAENDPQLAESIKVQFPNRFKDVDLSTPVTPDNLNATVAQAVTDALQGADNRNALGSMREQLGMTEIEFSDIKERLDSTAKSLVANETAKDYISALGTALQMVDPKRAEELAANAATKAAQERMDNANDGAATGGKPSPTSDAEAMEAKFDKNLPPGFSAEAPKPK